MKVFYTLMCIVFIIFVFKICDKGITEKETKNFILCIIGLIYFVGCLISKDAPKIKEIIKEIIDGFCFWLCAISFFCFVVFLLCLFLDSEYSVGLFLLGGISSIVFVLSFIGSRWFNKKLYTTPEEIESEKNPKSDNTKESETLSKNYNEFLNEYNEYYKNINTYSSLYNQVRCYTENSMFMFSHNGRLDAYTEYLKKEYESNYRMKNKIKGYETLILGYYFLLRTYDKLLDGYSELERYPIIKLNKTNYENLKNAIIYLFESHEKFLKSYYDLLITYKKLKGYKVILEDYKTIKTPKRPGYYSLDGYSENYLSEDFLKSMYFYLLDSYDKFNDYHSYSWDGRGIWFDYK